MKVDKCSFIIVIDGINKNIICLIIISIYFSPATTDIVYHY